MAELKEELQNLNIHRLTQQNINSALPYVGSALARLLNRGLQENQIVKLANLIELHPNMIQSYLQNDSNSRAARKDSNKMMTSNRYRRCRHQHPAPPLLLLPYILLHRIYLNTSLNLLLSNSLRSLPGDRLR